MENKKDTLKYIREQIIMVREEMLNDSGKTLEELREGAGYITACKDIIRFIYK